MVFGTQEELAREVHRREKEERTYAQERKSEEKVARFVHAKERLAEMGLEVGSEFLWNRCPGSTHLCEVTKILKFPDGKTWKFIEFTVIAASMQWHQHGFFSIDQTFRLRELMPPRHKDFDRIKAWVLRKSILLEQKGKLFYKRKI